MELDPSRSGRHEATRIYGAIFGRPIPEILVKRFAPPSEVLNQKAGPDELRVYYAALADTADLVALEVASRYTRRLPLLVAKFELMVRLAETLPDHQEFFVNLEPRRLRAFLALTVGAVATLWQLTKGTLLLARRRFV